MLVGKLSPRSTQCTPLHRFGIESPKPGKPWGEKNLAKTTPKKEKRRKREAIKQLAASHLELQRKGAAEKHRENKESLSRSLISIFSLTIADIFADF